MQTSVNATSMVVSVLDNGPGIPVAQMTRLLRPFERMNTARGNEGGSGLGLAIVKTIADRHGATLRLDRSTRLGGLRAELRMALATTLGSS